MGIAGALAARIGKRPFAPDTLAGLKLWLRGDGPFYSDTARTTLITADASSIAAWDDRSGAGNHVTQATAGKRPTLKTGIVNGQAVARFDGGDTIFSTTASGLDVASFTWLAVVKRTANTDSGLVNIGSSAGTTEREWDLRTTGQTLAKENAAILITGSSLGTSAFRVVVAHYDDNLPVTPTFVANTSTFDAFGVLGKLANGTLLYAYREGASHVGAADFGILRYRTSTDGGATWSAATTIATEASVDLRNLGGGVTPTGRFVIFYTRYNPAGAVSYSVASRYSDDNGATWSSPYTLTTTGMTNAHPHGALIRTDDGQLLMSWYGDDATTFYSYVAKSTDDGATWSAPIVVISGLAATASNSRFTESSFVALGGGVVLGLVRADNGTAFTQVISTDNGANWSSQGQVTFDTWTNIQPSTPPWLHVIGSRVCVFYCQRIAIKMRVAWADTAAVQAGVSAWGHRADIATPSAVDSGYPSVITLPSGRMVGVYYDGASSSDADLKTFTWPETTAMFLDGAYDGVGVTQATFGSGARLWIGSERDTGWYLTGDIAEILCYNRALSLDEINKLGAYLANRYALTWA